RLLRVRGRWIQMINSQLPIPNSQGTHFGSWELGIGSYHRQREAKAIMKYQIWGSGLEPDAVKQMDNACRLPVAVSGALMPDAHVGYGLPIGGVLATRDAVIPYAVGVDIACRMKMTVLDLPLGTLDADQPRPAKALERETRFGVGATFQSKRGHEVMDADWNVTPV